MIKAQKSWVKHRDTYKFQKGDMVWLEGHNLRVNQPTIKLAAKRHGPFKVIQVMSPVNYCLELPIQRRIHPVFHIDLVTTCDDERFFFLSFYLLFITCTFTVGHMTDDLPFHT